MQFAAHFREAVAASQQFDKTRLPQIGQPRLQHRGEASSQASRSAREVSAPSRSSHNIRNVQRRPSKSSSTMIGRPVLEPRTARFAFTTCFAIKIPLADRYRICSVALRLL